MGSYGKGSTTGLDYTVCQLRAEQHSVFFLSDAMISKEA